ncbi:MAG: dTDP-4-dehydrorhamnose 3,5-epimerase [Verrucomicrobia bacterium]|nr:dTDP-4-dehydrorhamnose 3,5-epimerase [Verrucomicrobiota bacterium]
MIKFPTKIHDAFLLKPKVFGDARGFFLESWNRDTFRDLGIDADFVQDNHSRSARHVLRGLHYQAGAAAQGKLVWVTSGTVFDVLVDLRQSSPTFGFWDGYRLTAEVHERLWVPPGCAHGFLVVSEIADFHYKVSSPYSPSDERSLRWDDPTLSITWPLDIGISPLVSQKDAIAASFEDCEKYD